MAKLCTPKDCSDGSCRGVNASFRALVNIVRTYPDGQTQEASFFATGGGIGPIAPFVRTFVSGSISNQGIFYTAFDEDGNQFEGVPSQQIISDPPLLNQNSSSTASIGSISYGIGANQEEAIARNQDCNCSDGDQEISCESAIGGICCIPKSSLDNLCNILGLN